MNNGAEATDQFGDMIGEKVMEATVPGMKEVHRLDENANLEDTLQLNSLQVGDELTLEFYPDTHNTEPKLIRLEILEVRDKSVSALASGGKFGLVNTEVSISASTTGSSGGLARMGVIKIGYFPEISYKDEALKEQVRKHLLAQYPIIGGIESPSGKVMDDEYFNEVRHDLDLPTIESRVDWYIDTAPYLWTKTEYPGRLADFNVEKPASVEFVQ